MADETFRQELIEYVDGLLKMWLIVGKNRQMLNALRGYLIVMPGDQLEILKTYMSRRGGSAEPEFADGPGFLCGLYSLVGSLTGEKACDDKEAALLSRDGGRELEILHRGGDLCDGRGNGVIFEAGKRYVVTIAEMPAESEAK